MRLFTEKGASEKGASPERRVRASNAQQVLGQSAIAHELEPRSSFRVGSSQSRCLALGVLSAVASLIIPRPAGAALPATNAPPAGKAASAVEQSAPASAGKAASAVERSAPASAGAASELAKPSASAPASKGESEVEPSASAPAGSAQTAAAAESSSANERNVVAPHGAAESSARDAAMLVAPSAATSLSVGKEPVEATRSASAPVTPKEPAADSASAVSSNWHFGGYGELLLQTSFYHPNINVDDPSYRDSHLDLARFSLFVGTDLTRRISFSSEIEIEHGGTGVAREVEWEEFGEYETEVEKGGEIVLEQAYLEGRVSDHFTLRGGHLLVPVGMTTLYHTPNLFASTRRPESEAQILPSIWHESGVELAVHYSNIAARVQVITGLDSTGFSSTRWIAEGSQRRFERPLINDPAAVLAIDFTGLPGTLIGASVYTSGTTRNRPKRDLYDLDARVTIADVHARFQRGPLKLRSLFLLGSLSNAAAITEANATLSSELGVPRTPVGRAAYAAYLEVAYDVLRILAPTSHHRLDAFARFDAYDSMWRAPASFDNPIMERRALTAGLNYFPHPRIVTKAEFVARWLNQDDRWGRQQRELNAALGFVL